ncbi:hypothetical protein [Aliagarivorans taiwanensis]|uniref:hypothetical protein n=1 Tax=Aliagarivorans taiwanensis TaxID=561966 RepID=UPI000478B8D8|nr:hypothetical protein [Aliagarivorans taiwanensis]
MSLLSWIAGYFDTSSSNSGDETFVRGMPNYGFFDSAPPHSSHEIDSRGTNPATGLPMADSFNGVDVAGNPYGSDLSDHDLFEFLDDSTVLHEQSDVFDDSLSNSSGSTLGGDDDLFDDWLDFDDW